MPDEYVQQGLGATPWDEGSPKTPRSEIRGLTISIKNGRVRLAITNGDELAEAAITNSTAGKLVAGVTRTLAGMVLDFGGHKWMINFGPLLRNWQPVGVPRRLLKALDPSSKFRDIKKCQRVRDDFLRQFGRLGGRLADPSV